MAGYIITCVLISLLLVFSIKYLTEKKPVKNIIYFIGILINLSLILIMNTQGLDYLIFLVLLVYISALTVLFTFVIMFTTPK